MAYWGVLRQFIVNAVFWVGVAAMVLAALAGDFSLVALFAVLVATNFLLLLLLKALAPNAFKEFLGASGKESIQSSSLGFRVYPLAYPKVLDEEGRNYVPELIHVDIQTGNGIVFRGNFKREALKQLENALSQALASGTPAQPLSVPQAKQAKAALKPGKRRKAGK
ncbi:MAG: hypothetical protein ACP5O3_03195 [Candidatus Micrarchaeia archaeon]|jgi:hypothetical protein